MKTYQFFLILSTSLAMKKNTPADKAIEHLWPPKKNSCINRQLLVQMHSLVTDHWVGHAQHTTPITPGATLPNHIAIIHDHWSKRRHFFKPTPSSHQQHPSWHPRARQHLASRGEPWQVAKRQVFFFSSSRWMDPWRWTPANVSRFFIEMNIHVLEASSVETFSWRWVLAFVCSKFWNSREFCVFVFGASDHASCSSVFPGWGAFPPTNVP